MHLPDFLSQDADGEIRLTGHRIGLYAVVRGYQEGRSAEQLADEYPSLPPKLIHAVIAYYLENKAEVDAYVEDYHAELEHQAAAPPGPGLIRLRRQMELLERAEAEYGHEPGWSALSVGEKLRRIEQEDHNEPV
jgi:uncharacterized protein (DUF433 family)